MQVQSTNDVTGYATANIQAKVQGQIKISLIKEAMKLNEAVMAKLQQGASQPPSNPNGSISLYA